MAGHSRSIGKVLARSRPKFRGLSEALLSPHECNPGRSHQRTQTTLIPSSPSSFQRINASQPSDPTHPPPSPSETPRPGSFPEAALAAQHRNPRSSIFPFSIGTPASAPLIQPTGHSNNLPHPFLLTPKDSCLSLGLHRSFSSSPVSSPLLESLSNPVTKEGSPEGGEKRRVRAKMTGIKQGVLKVNLVATLVRGMSVQDALTQLAVTPKRAAKTVSKVVHAAKSNAVTNHGLDENKLVVAEAFVGKDLFLKRVNPHGRGKSGIKVRQRSQLTVWVREMTGDEIAKRQEAQSRRSSWRKKLKRLVMHKLMPHQLVQTGAAIKPVQAASLAEAGSEA